MTLRLDIPRIETNRLDAHLDRLLATTPTEVSVASPLGNFTAGRMRLHVPGPGGAAELLFSEGVKLIYRPKMAEVQDK